MAWKRESPSALLAWWRSIGFEPDEIVRVAPEAAATTLAASFGEDFTVLVEISEGAVLVDQLRRAVEGARAGGAVVASILPGQDARASLLRAVGELYCLGFTVDWSRLDVADARFVRLGTYPWQDERCAVLADPAPAPVSTVDALPDVLVPRWVRADAASGSQLDPGEWLVLGDRARSNLLVAALARAGRRASAGATPSIATARNIVWFGGFDLAPVVELVQALARRGERCRRGCGWSRVAHAWSATRRPRTSLRSRAPCCGASAGS